MELNDTVKMELSDTELSSTDIAEEPSLLPEKSKFKYEKQYQVFSEWCDLNQIKVLSEDVLLKYFNEKSKKFKSSTLWAIFSMLRPTLMEQKDVDIKKFKKLLAFLKQQSVGYKPKKSKILQRSDIYKFLIEASDKQYLMRKVALIFGLAGACRREELANLSIDDIEDQNSILIVKIQDTRTRATRIFSLKNNGENSPDLLSYYRKYLALRPVNVETRRLFLKYSNGVCSSRLAVGINTISKIPRDVASYLGMRDFDAYTGHCFRSSSESFLADAGGDWSSDGRYGKFKASTSVTGDADLTVDYLDSGDSSELSIESPARELNTESLGSNVNTEELENFIETYESLPELWNPMNPDYVKKPKRNTALDKLLLIYRKIKPGAIRADVRRKINTLRCNYRKELKKIATSKRTGSGRDTVYKPSSWVFYALQFLDNPEQPVNANIQQLDETTQSNNHQCEARIKQHPLPVARTALRSFAVSPARPQSNKRRSVRNIKQNKLLPKVCDYLPKSNEEKNIPTIAIAWGETLTTLDHQQRIFAEKAINDILFEARQGGLSRYSVNINQDACVIPLPAGLSKTVPTSHQSHIFEDTSPEPSSEEQEAPRTISALFTNFSTN